MLTFGRDEIRAALQDNGRSTGPGPAARRVRGALAIGELAVACVLVIGAALVLKSFWRLMQVSPGFATERVLSAQIELPQARYPDGATDHALLPDAARSAAAGAWGDRGGRDQRAADGRSRVRRRG